MVKIVSKFTEIGFSKLFRFMKNAKKSAVGHVDF